MAYLDVIERSDNIYYWERDRDGNLIHSHVPVSDYCYFYVLDTNGNHESIFGHSLKKVHHESSYKMKDSAEKLKGSTFESDIAPIYKFLSDEYYKKCFGKPNIGLFDIEADFDLDEGKGYPTPDNPHGKVNSISLYDVHKNRYAMVMLSTDKSIIFKDEEEAIPIDFYYCHTEKQVLDTFIKLIEEVDVISGWNSEGYDVPYLMARMTLLYGSDRAREALSRDGFKTMVREGYDDYGNDATTYTLVGRSHLDMMKLYKKFVPGEKPSMKLDSIAEYEGVGNKIDYDGDLGRLYREDPHKFFKYSFHDTRLLKKINAKLKHIELAIMMGQQATVKFQDVLGSIRFLEHSIMNYAHFDKDEPKILPDAKDKSKESFEGAYVIQTASGKYDWVMSSDLGSLYPSCIRSLNMSPETFIMQCQGHYDDFIKVFNRTDDEVVVTVKDKGENVDTVILKAYELKDIIEEEKLTISANGSIFETSFRGIIPEVLDVWVSRRKEYKKLMKETDMFDYYNMRQMTQKLSNNSLYGAISNNNSRFNDMDIASSVTLTGQEVNKFQAIYIDKLLTGDSSSDTIETQ